MKNIKVFILLASVLAACAVSAENEKINASCQSAVSQKFTVARAKPVESARQEIILNCYPSADEYDKNHSTSSFNEKKPLNWNESLDVVLKFLASIAWPLAAIYIAFSFKNELSNLLGRLRKGKWAGAEFEFENTMQSLEEGVDSSKNQGPIVVDPLLRNLAATDPRGSILSAWVKVIAELLNLAAKVQLVEPRFAAIQISHSNNALNLVRDAKVLEHRWVLLYEVLRQQRNKAAHQVDFFPEPDSVISFIKVSDELINAMKLAASELVAK